MEWGVSHNSRLSAKNSGRKMSEAIGEQIVALKQSIAALEAQRNSLGDTVTEAALVPLREKLAELEVQQLAKQRVGQQVVELQRKLVTVLFMDIVGSTQLVSRMDPEEAMDVFDSSLKRLGKVVETHGGRVTRYMGDGLMAVFGAPVAHEDDPQRAVRAGLGLVEEARRVGEMLGISGFAVRVGVNTGLVAVGGQTEAEDTLMGSAVNLAQRLENAAPVEGVLISYDTYRHVREVFDLEILEPVKFKGFDEPISMYRAVRAKPRTFRIPSRGVEGVETRMVGRVSELKILQDAFLSLLQEGEGSIITITGEAGIGKSRLLYEFQNWLEFQKDIRFFQGRALQETQQSPFALLHEIFSFCFQIQDSDPLDRVHQKIEAGFCEILGREKNAILRSHFIGQLLGFNFTNSPYLTGVLDNPQHLHERAIVHLMGYFRELTTHYPVVILLEDIHWADDNSLELINQISPMTSTNPLLIICLGRPSLFIRRPNWGEGLDYHHRLELQALNKRESRNLIGEILQKVDQVPVDLRELVVSWAEGNPFYIEELIKMLIENGVILTGQESWRVIPDQLVRVNVPATLTGVLQARLDSLPYEERVILRLAAVIGRIFWEEAVDYLYKKLDSHETTAYGFKLTEVLSSLHERELIYHREDSTFSNTNEYLFRHTLLRDVAYENIPKRERRTYHKFTADWLQEITIPTGRSDEYAVLIADHYRLANEKDAAVEWLIKAGLHAKAQDAMKEARSYLTIALDLLPTDDNDRRWQILLERDEILGILGDRDGRLAEDDALVRIAEASSNENRLAEAYYRKGYFLYSLGLFQESLRMCNMAIEAARRAGNRKLEILALGIIIVIHKNRGEIDIATKSAEFVLEMADENLDDKTLATTLGNLAIVYENLDIQKAIQLHERSVELCNRLGNHHYMAIELSNIGYLYTMAGHAEKGVEALKQALELNRTLDSPRSTIYNLLNLGLADYRLGDHPSAVGVLIQAASAIEAMEDPVAEAACHTYFGLVSEQTLEMIDARQHYEKAVELWYLIGSIGSAQDAAAGIARTSLSMHDLNDAQRRAVELWAYLSQNGPQGLEFPIYAYLTCAQIFQAAQERKRMIGAIMGGYDELIKRAEKFSDGDWRDTYLHAVPEHATMIELWKQNHRSSNKYRS
jgi:class 3 adenylate cyclase/tetratricopeptide (TPR) repeat protein